MLLLNKRIYTQVLLTGVCLSIILLALSANSLHNIFIADGGTYLFLGFIILFSELLTVAAQKYFHKIIIRIGTLGAAFSLNIIAAASIILAVAAYKH